MYCIVSEINSFVLARLFFFCGENVMLSLRLAQLVGRCYHPPPHAREGALEAEQRNAGVPHHPEGRGRVHRPVASRLPRVEDRRRAGSGEKNDGGVGAGGRRGGTCHGVGLAGG